MTLNTKEQNLARAAAARFMPSKPAVKVEVKEPKQVIRPKYIFLQYNGRYRATVRLDGVTHLLGTYDTELEALRAQELFCIERGTTYEAVFNKAYPKNRKGSKS